MEKIAALGIITINLVCETQMKIMNNIYLQAPRIHGYRRENAAHSSQCSVKQIRFIITSDAGQGP